MPVKDYDGGKDPRSIQSTETLTPAGDGVEAAGAEIRGFPETPAQEANAYAGWVDLVARIRSGETDGMAELYHLFSKGIRFYLCRQLGPQELDDKIHDTFLVLLR